MNGTNAKTPERACFQHLGVALDTCPSCADYTPDDGLTKVKRPADFRPGLVIEVTRKARNGLLPVRRVSFPLHRSIVLDTLQPILQHGVTLASAAGAPRIASGRFIREAAL
jgi:hypothetical protein